MAVPTLSSSSPADAASSVAITVDPTLTFNTGIEASSINSGTVTLFRSNTFEAVSCSFTVSGSVVTVITGHNLLEAMSYRIVLSGDADNPAGRVQSVGGEYLAADVTILFTTGQERFVSLEEIAARTDIIRAGAIRETDPLADQPSTTGYLTIESMSPEAYAYDVDVTTTGIIITFNQPIDPTIDVNSLVTITQENVLGLSVLYAEDSDGDGVIDFDPDTDTATVPTGTLSVSGSAVVWTKSADPFLYNTKVGVSVSSSIEATSGATMEADYNAYFITDMFPQYVGVNAIRLALGPSLNTLYDSTIAQVIHKNSIDVWEMSGRSFSVATPKYAHRRYVYCQTIVDIINVLTLAAQLSLGQDKTLGDFSIRNAPVRPEYVYALKDALACLEKYAALISGALIAMPAIKGYLSPTRKGSTRYRTWDRFMLRKVPMVGTKEDRAEIFTLDLAYSLGDKDIDSINRYT